MIFSFLHVALFYGLWAHAQTILPMPLVPVAVKTPYLNAWLHNGDGAVSPARDVPIHFTNNRLMEWTGLVRVDQQVYQWMGTMFNSTRTVMSTITPTKTVFRIEAGPIQFNVTFFTPIEPSDYIRQSIPFSYLYIDGFSSNDSLPHLVQMYSDITAEWVSRDSGVLVQWDTVEGETAVYHHVEPRSPKSLQEDRDFAQDSVVYFATPKRSQLTWRTGHAAVDRTAFATNGFLNNTKDNNFRAVNDALPAFAYAIDLGNISPGSSPDPLIWAIGIVRDPLLSYSSPAQNRVGYYQSRYSDIDSVISDFLGGFDDLRNRSMVFDAEIISAASQISPEYVDILSLVTRQIFASMDITLVRKKDGSIDTSDLKIFMKDIGVSTRTNPVDAIYGAFPALLYFNSTIARALLEPLLELQSNSPYAAADLGNTYPNVSGNSGDTHTLAVESSGSMLIMAYAHAVKSGDGSLISRYYSTLQRWADYLVLTSLDPPSDTATIDDLSGVKAANLANLALKGILGVYSMAKINEAMGSSNTSYMGHAMTLAQNWTQLAMADTHIKSVFDQPNSWGMMYNIFPDIWLDFNIIDGATLTRQAQFYGNQSGVKSVLGLGSFKEDTVYPYWTLLTAATIPDNQTNIRNQLIASIHQRTSKSGGGISLPMRYSGSTGAASFGTAGSAIFGAAYGLLALNLPNVEIRVETFSFSNPSKAKKNVGAIVGGVIGGLAGILIVAFGFLFWNRRRRAMQAKVPRGSIHTQPNPFVLLPSTPEEVSWADVSPMLNKQREALGRFEQYPMTNMSGMPSSGSRNSTSVSGTEDLRAEVAQLRRDLEVVRDHADPPPGYT